MTTEKLTPYVRSFKTIINAPTIRSSAGILVAMPVICNKGPLDPTVVDNAGFADLFMDSVELKRSMSLSQILAYELSKSCPICVLRVVPDSVGEKLNSKTSSGSAVSDLNNIDAPFAMTAKYPAKEDFVKVRVLTEYTYNEDPDKDIPGTIVITESKGDSMGGKTYQFQFSLNMDKTDEYGNSIYIEDLSNRQNLVHFTVGKPANVSTTEDIGLGTISGYKNLDDKSLNPVLVNNAINKLLDFDMAKISLIFDGGLTHKNIASNIIAVAEKISSLGVISHPFNLSDPDGVANYANDFKSSWGYMASPWRRDTKIAPFSVQVPYSFMYIQNVVRNAKNNQEFAPVFGVEKGSVEGTSDEMSIKYVHRPKEFVITSTNTSELVQRSGVNPVIYSNTRGTSYLVNNWTLQGKKDVVSEENIRRMWDTIDYDLNVLLEQFISYPNTKVTRQEVEEVIEKYFNNVVYNWGTHPVAHRKRVDPYDPSRPANLDVYVDVQFPGSIKYITIYQRSVPVLEA